MDEVSLHVLGPDNAVLLIGADAFDGPVDPGWLADFVARQGHAMVFAMADNVVVGFASGVDLLHPDKPPQLFVNEVGVNEGWRRRGIATALVRALFDLARARGCQTAWVATEGDNVEARSLYRRMGGAEAEQVVVYDWDNTTDKRQA